MNRDETFIRELESYLDEYEGPTPLPDPVRDAVRARLPRTRQMRPLPGLLRDYDMTLHVPAAARLGLVAAAVVIAVAAGINLVPRASVGAPGGAQSPVPSTTSTSPTPTPVAVMPVPGYALQPGKSYRFGDPFEAPFTVGFPSRWQVRELNAGDSTFFRSAPADGAPDVSVMLVENVFEDPCRDTEPRDPPVAYTVEGVVEGLRTLVGFEATRTTEASVGDVPARYFELTNSIDTEVAGCAGGVWLPLFTIRGTAEPPATIGGMAHRVWVLEHEGTVVVIVGWDGAEGTPEDAAEVDAVVNSIRFE